MRVKYWRSEKRGLQQEVTETRAREKRQKNVTAIYIRNYNYSVKYCSSQELANTDALRRLPTHQQMNSLHLQQYNKCLICFTNM